MRRDHVSDWFRVLDLDIRNVEQGRVYGHVRKRIRRWHISVCEISIAFLLLIFPSPTRFAPRHI